MDGLKHGSLALNYIAELGPEFWWRVSLVFTDWARRYILDKDVELGKRQSFSKRRAAMRRRYVTEKTVSDVFAPWQHVYVPWWATLHEFRNRTDMAVVVRTRAAKGTPQSWQVAGDRARIAIVIDDAYCIFTRELGRWILTRTGSTKGQNMQADADTFPRRNFEHYRDRILDAYGLQA